MTDNLDWDKVQWVLLDMDGTLLDLHFDNHFWREFVPQRYAERHELDVDSAKRALYPMFHKVEGTMEWYCVDYWSRELGLDIALMKREIDHLISVHPHVVEFLDACRNAGKRVLLVTNAHQKSLALKMERTQLEGHFDYLVCSHDYGKPKEDPSFWEMMRATHPFVPERSLLVDDSLAVLRSAHQYGIAHLRSVRKPDTRQPAREIDEFSAIDSFEELLHGLS